MKINKKIFSITIIAIIILCIHTICYAAEQINFTQTPNISEIKGKISRKLYELSITTYNVDNIKGAGSYTINTNNYKIKIQINSDEKQITAQGPKSVVYSGYMTIEDKKNKPQGSNGNSSQISDPITNPGYYDPTGTMQDEQEFLELGKTIITIIRILGTIIAVITLMIIGLRYMFGSLEERANYKETMIPYIIGAIMLFTIPNVLGIIYELVTAIKF